ncbi:MAG: prepilin-type N-terminal cleavage/methylation domain-containing protein [Patescibacteria group bacterium]
MIHDSNDKGFTVIELIIVIGIAGALAAGAFIGYRSMSIGSELKTTAFKVTDVLNLARQRTLASLAASNYGVHFEQEQFILFKGAIYDPLDPDNIFYPLTDSLEISEIVLNGGGSEVVFDRITGETANAGAVKIQVQNDSSRFKTVEVLSSGRADVSSGSLAPANTLITDSRHVHFAYAQDTRSANTLSLEFPGYITNDINFQDYLDPGKTVFDWSGSILVNGSNQVLRVHTHSLTSTSTAFSVTRDRRYNNAALNISLDGQNLINYAADGTTTQGTSLWVSAPVWQ